jgi:hypothetical protein
LPFESTLAVSAFSPINLAQQANNLVRAKPLLSHIAWPKKQSGHKGNGEN